MIGAPVTVAQLWGEDILLAAGQSSETAGLAARYLAGLTWSMIPAWCFIALRNFMGAVNRPQPALWVTLTAIPVNGLLAYGLIHGTFGLPRLDMLGAGLATTIVISPVRGRDLVAARARSKYRSAASGVRTGADASSRPSLSGLRRRPQWGLFSSALLMGWIGTTALAAHRIACKWRASCSWFVRHRSPRPARRPRSGARCNGHTGRPVYRQGGV
jgi:MATE family multidrug resistance protein